MININVSNLVKFKVEGTINDENGVSKPFDFWLTCERLPADQLTFDALRVRGETNAQFMQRVIKDWEGVRDHENKPVPYSDSAFTELMRIPGVDGVAISAYLAGAGAKAKN